MNLKEIKKILFSSHDLLSEKEKEMAKKIVLIATALVFIFMVMALQIMFPSDVFGGSSSKIEKVVAAASLIYGLILLLNIVRAAQEKKLETSLSGQGEGVKKFIFSVFLPLLIILIWSLWQLREYLINKLK